MGSGDLSSLIELWRETRDSELGEVVERLSTIGRLPYPKSAKTDAKQTRWMTMSNARKASDLPALLSLLHDAYSTHAIERIAALGAWPEDPRISSALARQFERPAHLNISAMPVWEALGELLLRYADPRAKARLGAIAALGTGWSSLFRPFMRAPIAKFLDELRARLDARLASRSYRALTGDERTLISTVKPPPGLDDALASVWANPDDLTRRLVYADMLTAAGELRGEFITLQCLDAPTAQQRRRAAELVTEHGKTWAGPLAPVIEVTSWERGFPAVVTVKLVATMRQLGAVLGHPAWSTVHTIEFETIGYGVHAEVVVHPSMTRVQRVTGLSDADVRAIARRGGPFPFRSLVVHGVEPKIFKHLGASIFPALVHVQLTNERKLSSAALDFMKTRPEVEVRVGPFSLETARRPAPRKQLRR